MWKLYHNLHKEIWKASYGTDISPAYLASVISLESSPPGNWKSQRFEEHIYKRLLAVKYKNKRYGSITQKTLAKYSDAKLREFSTSYGPTQMMGYQCLKILCTIEDLQGPYHLQWAIVWMENRYGKYARKKAWASCFRIHNTGRVDGKTYHADYVSKGLKRMHYYNEWQKRKGRLF